MRRLLPALLLSLAASLLGAAPAGAKTSQEYASANGVLPEATVRAGVYASYDGVPRRVVLRGSVDLSKLRVKTNDTVTVSYVFSIVSKGCGAVTVNRKSLAMGATVTSRCVNGRARVTEITRSNTLKAKVAAGGAGVLITTYDVPVAVGRSSQFLSISMKVTAKGAGKPITLTGTRALPNH